MQNGVKAVLFDFDGTLVFLPIDYSGMRRRLQRLFSKHGIKSSFHPLLGSIEQCLSEMMLKKYPHFKIENVKNDAYRIIEDEEVKAVKKAKLANGVKDVIAGLKQKGVKTAIVSRNGRKCIQMCISKFELPALDVIVARDDLRDAGSLKPDPRHALLCLKGLRTKPQNAIIVGDSHHDIEMGKRAGIRTVLVGHKGKNEKNLKPDYITEKLIEISILLKMGN